MDADLLAQAVAYAQVCFDEALDWADIAGIEAVVIGSGTTVRGLDLRIDHGGDEARTPFGDVYGMPPRFGEDFGRIDILINHASVEPHVPLLEIDEWDWHRVLDVNLTGAFLMAQSTGRVMRAQGSGVIVNLISLAAREPGQAAAFLASMHGLAELTRQAARELEPYGIRVYAVESGPDITERVFDLLYTEER